MKGACVERDKLYQVDDIGFLNCCTYIQPTRLPATDAAGRPQQHTAARKYEKKYIIICTTSTKLTMYWYSYQMQFVDILDCMLMR